ncbi:MAG: hypothetical protein NZ580_07195 [Bacteroidia bacterium]|nr:hypothetical protein [Bacteroidia bacterium]MDW8236481.1 hypothetical protein [Bacteroidia bacterium]
MLAELSIQNFALLRTAQLTWGGELNIITGETGAGKSLLVEALGILLGYKGSFPPLQEKAVLEATFEPIPESVQTLLEEPSSSLILRCELLPSGRKRYFLNDSPTSSQNLRQIAYYLVEIHSQHETQQLFQSSFQRELLDSYADLNEELRAYQQKYRRWIELKEKIEAWYRQREYVEARQRELEGYLAELSAARLSVEEYAFLEQWMRRMEHQAQAIQTLSQWQHHLSESPHAPPSILREAMRSLQRLPLGEIPAIVQLLEQARSLIQEASAQIEILLSQFNPDPAEAERNQQRYDLYNSLLLKYRLPTVDALVGLYQQYKDEYERLCQERDSAAPLESEYQSLTQELLERAYKLELARIAAAQTLADHVQAYFSELALGYAHFHIAVERLRSSASVLAWQGEPVELTPYGFSSVTFLLRTARDYPLAPLSQVASGGELSRIMLALKAALAEKVQMPTLVLDEIDTGLSGESARRMGEFLAKLGKKFQIILITHLPSIAAQRGKHFRIWKQVAPDGHVETHIKPLSLEERIEEVAHLLGGEAAGEAAIAAARELLASAC